MFFWYYLSKDRYISFSAGKFLGEGCGEGKTAWLLYDTRKQADRLPPWCKMIG